ncbi:amidohydrolase [Heyndrickxia acidicola]|uniref:Amidohydrolase n=1 Tax=Heyndrickxia acidicola TaxID=209389 RepID=A0ABU6MG79_9BACI|nr:amidohydrolase [Heyndrickxia acidicola]MED1203424.1 amidohydrolase [Heyndrickxia acidicola]
MLVLKNVNGYDGRGGLLQNAAIFIENGRFGKIGEYVRTPEGCEVLDMAGMILTPGLIDVHTHLGVQEQGVGVEGRDYNETSSAVTPQVRTLDGINPMETGFIDARQAGVTTVQVMPGSANVIGGETVVLKTAGDIVDEMVLKCPAGLKAATGENPKREHGQKGRPPVTRMGIAALLREELIKTQDYLEERKKGKAERNLGLETLAKVLNKEIPMRIHAHRADDIATVLRLKREFDFNLTIEHCTEGHLIAPFIAKHQVRVSVGPTMSARSKVELANKGWHTLVALAEAGVPFSITTDHPIVSIEHLMACVILAVKAGVREELALQAVTLNAALHLGVEDRVGSVEEGKDADFVVWSGDPFDLRSRVLMTFINGVQV